jgi:predicted nucleic acid-binding protein
MGMSKIYLDACIVIYFVEKHPNYAAQIDGLINNLGANDTLCYSPLIRLECLVMPLRTMDVVLKRHYESFFKAQEMIEITADRFDEAAQLRSEFNSLKTPDALHLATALHHKCDEFWTNDNRLNQVAPTLVKNVLISRDLGK